MKEWATILTVVEIIPGKLTDYAQGLIPASDDHRYAKGSGAFWDITVEQQRPGNNSAPKEKVMCSEKTGSRRTCITEENEEL